jgi:4-amino-4-deoxy-L-arabinose transferase-like glycosyltransferase
MTQINTTVCGGPRWFEWLGLTALFLLAGSLGHDPWKQDETYSFGIIYHFYITHSWLVPTNAGAPFMEKPPLYYWTAAVFCRLLGGALLPLHDAARLASVFYMAITCAAVWASSQVLFHAQEDRRAMGRATLALLLGCFGLARHAHDMFTDMALLAGTSVALLGMALVICAPERWLRAGLALGAGAGMAFLSKGLFVPVMLVVSGIVLLAMLPQLRRRETFRALGVALFAASPFLLVWPLLLYQYSPALFVEWFWQNNVGRFLGFSVDRLGAGNGKGYMLYAVTWFAFPAFPLAAATVYFRRREWRAPEYILPLAVSGVGFALLLSSASARALYLLPLLPAFALLGAQALVRLPVRPLAGWNIAVRSVASIIALIIVVMWLCLLHPAGPQPFARLYGGWLPPGFLPERGQGVACLAALAAGMFWLASFRLHGRSYENTAYLWLAAVALPWCLAMTLLLPWMDETRSFRSVLADVTRVISAPQYADACIARRSLGESVAPMWEYFGHGRGLGPVEDFDGKRCPLLLLMTGKSMAPVSDPRWHLIWKGSRRMDDKDELQLYERNI